MLNINCSLPRGVVNGGVLSGREKFPESTCALIIDFASGCFMVMGKKKKMVIGKNGVYFSGVLFPAIIFLIFFMQDSVCGGLLDLNIDTIPIHHYDGGFRGKIRLLSWMLCSRIGQIW